MSNSLYEEIKHNSELVAIIIRKEYKSEKLEFFSPPEFSQQIGYIPYKKGKSIPSHFHRESHRGIKYTQEVLFIRKGKIRVDLYTVKKEYIDSRELAEGDIIFLCSGGHGFKMLEDSEMFEVKQGPYTDKDSDKEIFKGVADDPGK